MRNYLLSVRAEDDIAAIADYMIERFGVEQARRYRDGLETCFATLAENPQLGSSAEALAPDLRRFEHEHHVVFYQPREDGVLIVRVLHGSMDVTGHF